MNRISGPAAESALDAAESFEDWNRAFIARRFGILLWIALGAAVTYVVADVATLGWDLQTLGFRSISIAVIGALLVLRNHDFLRRNVDAVIVAAGLTVSCSVLAMNAAWAAAGAVQPIQSCYTAALGITLVFVANAVLLPSRWVTHATLQGLTLGFLVFATPQLVEPAMQASGAPWYLISVFWICVFLDLSVHLYTRLHRSEFDARTRLHAANADLRDVSLQRKRYLDGLVHVGISASEARPEFQTRAVLDAMIRLLKADRAFLHLLGPDSRLVTSVGRNAAGEDVAPDEALGADRISVPLRMRDRPLGEVSFEIPTGSGALSAADDEFLRALASHAAIALDTVRTTDELREARDRALESARLAAVESGPTSLDLRPVDVAKLGARLETAFRAAASEGENGLEVMVSEDVGHLTTDPDALEAVLGRLLENACRFTRQGKITCQVQRADTRVSFRVSDNGVGMSADALAHCFDPFHRADRQDARGAGAGLGLGTARRLSELLGGQLTAASEIDRGSTFVATLPDRAAEPRA